MNNGGYKRRDLTPSHQSVLDMLQQRTGLIFPDARLGEITTEMDRAAQALNLTLAQYACLLACDNAAFDDLCNKVIIAETYFFRDPKQFEFVKTHVIPAWIQARPDNQRDDQARHKAHISSPSHQNLSASHQNLNASYQILSAGSSTGEEAYSLAILFDQEGLGGVVNLTAADICKQSLACAATAQYSPWSLRTSDQEFCQNYFEHKEGLYSLKEKYSSRVRFAHLNLVDDISVYNNLGLADLDLIFCRNVLIYFDGPAITKVIKTLHSLLKPGGFLVLGPSDPSASQIANFEVVVCESGVFYKKNSAAHDDCASHQIHAAHPQLTNNLLLHTDTIDTAKQPLSQHKHQTQRNKLPATYKRPNVSPQVTLNQAETAYTLGQYEKAFNLTGSILDDPLAAILHIRALANFKGSLPAEKVLNKLLKQHVSCFHLQYLHGHLLMDLGQLEAALAALKRCLFLDSRATMAHFSLALVQKRLGDKAEAQRSFRNVIELCKNRPPDEIVPYGDGERVKILAIQASLELNALAQS